MKDKLAHRVEAYLAEARRATETLASEFEEVQRYYNGEYPRRNHKGSSTYRSLDVYGAVSRLKAQLLETFGAHDSIVEFAPQGPEDVELARVATAVCEYVIHRQNRGYAVFSDVIHNALTCRVGVAKVWWEKCLRPVRRELPEPVPAEALPNLLGPNDELLEVEEVEGGLVKATILAEEDHSQVKIAAIPPEDFLICPDAESIEEAEFVGHRRRVSFAELLRMGFDRRLAEEAIRAGDGGGTDNILRGQRFEDVGGVLETPEGAGDPRTRRVYLYEVYLKSEDEESGKEELLQVFYAGGKVLSKEPVARKPFVAFVPLPLPFRFWGENFAKLAIPTQNAKTVLVRGVLDHTMVTTNPRFMVVKGALVNPKELIDNRLGGIVNVLRPDAVLPIQQAPLNPFIFETLKVLDYQQESHTGISQLSTGLNKDAIAKQNSFALVDHLANMSMVGQKVIARRFALDFLVPLYLLVYETLLANETRELQIEIAGRFVPVTPGRWGSRKDVKVAFHLGYGEADRRAQELVALDQVLTADPMAAGTLYSLAGKRRLLSEVLRLKGLVDVDAVLTPVEQVRLPDPTQSPEFQLRQAELALREKELAIKEREVQAKAEATEASTVLEAERAAREFELKRAQHELAVLKERHVHEIALRELEAAERKAKADPETVRGIFSPNS